MPETEPNPALGLRGIRLLLKRPAAAGGAVRRHPAAAPHGPVRILLPMVTTPTRCGRSREIMAASPAGCAGAARIADPLPPLGVMIETPGAALAADALALEADFFAIGTNDLTMYTLAMDRGEEQVAHLYDPLHPAVLRLIQFATEAALRAAHAGQRLRRDGRRPAADAAAAGPRHARAVDECQRHPAGEAGGAGADIADCARFARRVMEQSGPGAHP